LFDLVARAGDANPARRLIAQFPQCFYLCGDLLEQGSDDVHQSLSCFGRGDVAGGAHQQVHAEVLFQRTHGMA